MVQELHELDHLVRKLRHELDRHRDILYRVYITNPNMELKGGPMQPTSHTHITFHMEKDKVYLHAYNAEGLGIVTDYQRILQKMLEMGF